MDNDSRRRIKCPNKEKETKSNVMSLYVPMHGRVKTSQRMKALSNGKLDSPIYLNQWYILERNKVTVMKRLKTSLSFFIITIFSCPWTVKISYLENDIMSAQSLIWIFSTALHVWLKNAVSNLNRHSWWLSRDGNPMNGTILLVKPPSTTAVRFLFEIYNFARVFGHNTLWLMQTTLKCLVPN